MAAWKKEIEMKYLIASDIHGSEYWCSRMKEAFEKEKADEFVFLGDILYHGPRNDLPEEYLPKKVIADLNALKDKIYVCMRGNCDAEVDEMVLDFPLVPGCKRITLNGRLFYMTHGHKVNANGEGEHLPAGLGDGDILLHGHTHIPMAEMTDVGGKHFYLLNPGSVSIPKGGFKNSYAVLDDELLFTVRDFDGNTRKEISLK